MIQEDIGERILRLKDCIEMALSTQKGAEFGGMQMCSWLNSGQ